MRRALAVLGAAGLALGVAAAGTQPTGQGGPRGARVDRAEGMARFLGLSEEQKAQVRTVMEGQRAKHEALREKLEENRGRLQQALESASPDPLSVGELAIESHRLREEGKALREAQDKAVRALLTPEQQAKFDAMKALRDEGGAMGGRGLRHGDSPRGPRP